MVILHAEIEPRAAERMLGGDLHRAARFAVVEGERIDLIASGFIGSSGRAPRRTLDSTDEGDVLAVR